MGTGCTARIEPGKVSALSPNPTPWVDEFRACVTKGLRCESIGEVGAAVIFFAQAVRLYRDGYPTELPDADWALARREQAKDRYLLALDKLAAYYFGRGELPRCIRFC